MAHARIIVSAFMCLTINTVVLWYFVPSHQARYELDSTSYDRLAKNIIERNQLRDPENPTAMPAHTLGYPLFLAIIYAVFGQHESFVIIAQLACLLLVLMCLYFLSAHLFGIQAACLTLLFAAFNLGFITYTHFFMPEIILITVLSAFLYFFVKQHSISAGLSLALSIIVRPAALYFLPVIVIFLATTQQWKKIIFFSISLAMPLLLYAAMNYQLYQQAVISPLAQENLYYYFLPRLLAQVNAITLDTAHKDLDSRNLSTRKKILSTTLYHHPVAAFSVWFCNVIKSLCGLYSTQLKVLLNPSIKGGACSFFNQSGTCIEKAYQYCAFGTDSALVLGIVFLEIIFLLIEYLCAFAGILYLLRQRQLSIALFFISYISYFMLITGHDGCGRYRMMLEPVLLVCAGVGVMRLYHEYTIYLRCYSRRRQRHAAVATES